jgi:hypothetical protein
MLRAMAGTEARPTARNRARGAAKHEGAENIMAKKTTNPIPKTDSCTNATTTVVRNSAIPRLNVKPAVMSNPGRQITDEQIAERAYFISISGTGGTQQENWLRAERELREQASRGLVGSTRPLR